MFDVLKQVSEIVQDVFDESDDEIREERENIAHQPPASRLNGTKKAVFVGINYTGTSAALKGCINDVENISEFVFEKFGFRRENAMILTDDAEPDLQPTRANILRAMDWLVEGAQEGDSLMWHFSGHGHQTKDTSGDEADGLDEVLVPLDFKSASMITDDEVHDRLVKPVPEGVRLTIFMDCCHSGSIVDLPYTYSCSDDVQLLVGSDSKRKALLNAVMGAGTNYMKGDTKGAIAALAGGFQLGKRSDAATRHKEEKLAGEDKHGKSSSGDVIMFSGCMDDQTSADAVINKEATGAMSHALVKTYRDLEAHEGGAPNFTKVLKQMRTELAKGNYTQVPQMSTGRLMSMEHPFYM